MFSHPFPLLSPRDIARPGWHTAPPAVAPWNSSEPDPFEHPSDGGDPTVRHPWSEETPASWVAVAGKAIIRVPTIPVCVSLWIHTWTSRCDMWRQSHILPPTSSPRDLGMQMASWKLPLTYIQSNEAMKLEQAPYLFISFLSLPSIMCTSDTDSIV